MRAQRAEPVISDEQKEKAETEIVEQSKRIEFYITEYSIELLANKMRDNEFFVPAYQREFTWEPERKSRFIESVVMGLPIPFLFFWEMEDGKLEIVDGSQRLRTIQEFVLMFPGRCSHIINSSPGMAVSDVPMKNSGHPSAAAANPVPAENSVRPVEANAVNRAYCVAVCSGLRHKADR